MRMNILRKLFAVAVVLAGVQTAFGQKVFSADSQYQADVKVFVVDKEYRADIVVFRTDKPYRAKAGENKGVSGRPKGIFH